MEPDIWYYSGTVHTLALTVVSDDEWGCIGGCGCIRGVTALVGGVSF